MIYFPFENVPKVKDLNLFDFKNGEAVGSLVPYLSGFIS
jgi:hypothetical protein